jgi:excisionase family DNA binding protein
MKRQDTQNQQHMQPVEPLIPALALNVENAAKALSISRTMLFRILKDGQLRSVMIGNRRIIPVQAIKDYLNGFGDAA